MNLNPTPLDPKYRFKPGSSGNPGGKPTGSRNSLTAAFLKALAEDFHLHGKATIEKVRQENPTGYLNAIVRLCPKELEVTQTLDEFNSEEMQLLLLVAKQYIAIRQNRVINASPVPANDDPPPVGEAGT